MAKSELASRSFQRVVSDHIDQLDRILYETNQAIHTNPELSYEEHFAHDTLSVLLEAEGFSVKRNAYGLDTSFEAQLGTGGREVIFCAEYDALPEIGHGCGHNLIATSSLAAFLGAARAIKELKLPGRVRILGTPAEEGGGGKIKLLRAGAFDGASAALMAHAVTSHAISSTEPGTISGCAAFDLIASMKFRVEFHGKPAHAAGEPWNGLNALDAAVAAYNNVSMLRQQIRPDERIHGVFEAGGTVPNIITGYTRMNWYIRSPTVERGDELQRRVEACIEAGAKAAGCTVNFMRADNYEHCASNPTLCQVYTAAMAALGENIIAAMEKPFVASTDMGNVTRTVPGIHGGFVIPTGPTVALHSVEFATAAGTREAHNAAIKCSKGLAELALTVLTNDDVARSAQREFNLQK